MYVKNVKIMHKTNRKGASKVKVYITSRSFGRYCREALDLVRGVADVNQNPYGRTLTRYELLEVVKEADGVIGNDLFSRDVIERAKKLKIICRHGASRTEAIDREAATEKGIVVTYTPDVYAEAVADFTFGLILCLCRSIPQAHFSTKHGGWESSKFAGTGVHGKALGIVGLGSIGFKVAKRAQGFDMRIFTYDPFIPEERAEKVRAEKVDLETLLKEADVITIHASLTDETRGLIGERELSLMKDRAILVNTARGGILDESALYDALRKGKILGAAIDVYNKEPPGADFPLFTLDNVIATPHIASYAIEAIQTMDMMNAEDIVNFFRGKKPRHVANPAVLKRLKLR